MPDAHASPSVRYLSPTSAAAKFDRKLTWLWDKIKNDPEFPKPIYIGPKSPLLDERLLDEYAAKKAARFTRATA